MQRLKYNSPYPAIRAARARNLSYFYKICEERLLLDWRWQDWIPVKMAAPQIGPNRLPSSTFSNGTLEEILIALIFLSLLSELLFDYV